MEKVNHQFLLEEFFIPTWEIKHLFLGTFNPKGGAEVRYFYGRQTNYTWPILSEIFGHEFIVSNLDFFLEKLKENGIACMDMIRSVEVEKENLAKVTGKGYKDVHIINNGVKREYNTDHINDVIKKNRDVKVYSTWGKGPTLINWQKEIEKIENITQLVSPSKAAKVPKGQMKFSYILNDWKKNVIV